MRSNRITFRACSLFQAEAARARELIMLDNEAVDAAPLPTPAQVLARDENSLPSGGIEVRTSSTDPRGGPNSNDSARNGEGSSESSLGSSHVRHGPEDALFGCGSEDASNPLKANVSIKPDIFDVEAEAEAEAMRHLAEQVRAPSSSTAMHS
mmetsp:Transcript_8308/g.25838  ORF Transcript_8308/g.25838 Transcript_8308/m.25838 type:complete len:152 (-) Transcript_8308:20-475(-)|eukprot:scaffold76160_cov30-Tisochrysis_lutea.AAC.9